MKARSRWVTLALAAALAAPAWAGEAHDASSTNSRLALERALVEALARGDGAAEAATELARQAPQPRRTVSQVHRDPALEQLEAAAQSLDELGRGRAERAPSAELLAIWKRYRAAAQAVSGSFAAVRERLAAAKIAGELSARLDAAEHAVATRLTEIDRLFGIPLAQVEAGATRKGSAWRPTPALGDAFARFSEIWSAANSEPATPLLRASNLPYGPAALASRTPVVSPAITPSYLAPDASAPPAAPADLATTEVAPLSPTILTQAEALGYDYVRIFEFVRNEIATEWYAGVLRGAEGTLATRRGNDVDQAALLVALFRASSLPCHYVRGVVELPIAELEADLGLDSSSRIVDFLARSGIAVRPVVAGGQVASVQVEHTWVSALVPYSNYRGTTVDFSGKTWLPLAPALKRFAVTAPTRVLAEMGFDGDAAVSAYLSVSQPTEPLTEIRGQVESFLANAHPGASYGDQLGRREVVPQVLGLLPSSLPAAVVATTGESADLLADAVVTAHLRAYGGELATDPVLLDAAIPVARLAGHRVTLSYLPATVDDHRTVQLFGGLDLVPAYLVHLRPVIKIDGRQEAVGDAIPMGAGHRLAVEIDGPWGSVARSQTLIAGSYQALAVGAPRTLRRADSGDDPMDTERVAARLLSQLVLGYGQSWDQAEDELAGLAGVTLARPLPSLAFAADAVRVTQLFGLPFDLDFQGVTLDAALRVADPIASDESAARSFTRLSALEGSALEHFVFERDFQVDAISADKGLGLARSAGTEVLMVDGGNVASALARMSLAPAVEAAIADFAARGLVIEAPIAPIARNDWRGAVFRVEDLDTGAAGYFLAGGLAGGAPTVDPDNWILQFLAQQLGSPYSEEPNPDPLSAASISKVGATDEQDGEVGEELPQALEVVVRDPNDRPVLGAMVTFDVLSGGGQLLDDQGVAHDEYAAATDEHGVATARLRLGTDTRIDPVNRRRHPGDRYESVVGAQIVTASVATPAGTVALTSPFTAFAFPGPPVELTRSDASGTYFEAWRFGMRIDTAHVQALDRYKNPVANLRISATVQDGHVPAECTNPIREPSQGAAYDARVCAISAPVLGECGAGTVAVETDQLAAAFGVISPNFISSFDVTFEAAGLQPLVSHYVALYTGYPQGNGQTECVAKVFRIEAQTLLDEVGHNVQAARPGGTYSPLRFSVLWLDDGRCGEDVPQPLDGTWRRANGEVRLTVSNSGSVTDPFLLGVGDYETSVRAGLSNGENVVSAGGWINFPCCPNAPDCNPAVALPFSGMPVSTVWGVEPRITGVLPQLIRVSGDGRTIGETTITYEIAPPEYVAASADLEILADSEVVAVGIGSARKGAGYLVIHQGIEVDPAKTNTVRVVLNRGTAAELRSDPAPLSVAQSLFYDVSRVVYLKQDVDVPNERVCLHTSPFEFSLVRAARVDLVFRGVYRAEGDPDPHPDGSTYPILVDADLSAGPHPVDLPAGELPAGEYEWELVGTPTDGSPPEVVHGYAQSSLQIQNSLAVGHTLREGVDVFDGHLTLSREDFRVPARGLDLSFERTFSSTATGEPGPLGRYWTHNWDSHLVVTECGEVVVIGAQGSGMTFVDDGANGLKPTKGYHGSLVANAADGSFDFYAVGGSQSHYVRESGSTWVLAWISDPNGNRTRLTYESSAEGPGKHRLVSVADGADRTIAFRYATAQIHGVTEEFVSDVDGPGGLHVHFSYDYPFGVLTHSEREPQADGSPSASETYGYELRPAEGPDDRKLLVSVMDDVSQATTSYHWRQHVVGLPAGLQDLGEAVAAVIRPNAQATGTAIEFEYDTAALAARTEPVRTTVTDALAKVWKYTLNRYGAVTVAEDPFGHETTTEWPTDDVLPKAKIDANHVRTDFTYDGYGNLTSETIAVTDVEGRPHTYVRTNAYESPGSFVPPFIKNRLRTRTDRNGATTTFGWDNRGNLLTQSTPTTSVDGPVAPVTVTHTYYPSGDLQTTTDARGHRTTFFYDAYGNLRETVDAKGHSTRSTFDLRGRESSREDARHHTTAFEYDVLGRRTKATFPKVAGDSQAAFESVAYDDETRTKTETDARTFQTVSHFDLEGHVDHVTDRAGSHKELVYDLAGNKTLESTWFDPETPRFDTTFDYDAAGRLTDRHEPLGRSTHYDYDAAGNVVLETLSDAMTGGFVPRVTKSEYDELDRRIVTSRQLGAEWQTTKTLLDGEGNAMATIDPLGRRTDRRFDELGRKIEETGPEWRVGRRKVSQWLYDGNGHVIEERQRNERRVLAQSENYAAADQVRKFEYDELDRLHRREDAEGHGWITDYDEVGNLKEEIDPRTDHVTHEYDERNRRILTRQWLNRVTFPPRVVETRFGYDANGNRIEERWPNGNVVRTEYDHLDRAIRKEDSLGVLLTAHHDARGNRTYETDANGQETTGTFDALNRVTAQDLPAGRHLEMGYDVAGNRTSLRNPRHLETRYEYDALDRLVKITDPAPFGYEQSFTYDLANFKRTATDRRQHTTSFEPDPLGRVARIADPDPLPYSRNFTYDALGNVLTETDRRQIVTIYAYDRENRRTDRWRAGVLLEHFEYDDAGNRRFVTDAKGNTTSFDYDERNFLVAENAPEAAVTTYGLDEMGDRVQIVDPEQRATTFAYDRRRRLREERRVMAADTTADDEVTSYCYDGNGNRIAVRRPEQWTFADPCGDGATGALLWRYVYDAANRLTSVSDPLGHPTAYTYDENGNRRSQSDAKTHTTTFIYDELDRLRQKAYPKVGGVEAAETYDYDENGNLTSVTDPKGQEVTKGYDFLNRLTSELYTAAVPTTGDDLRSITYTLDGNGNATRVEEVYGSSGARGTNKTFDDFDRLESVTDPRGESLTYGYDANGNRERLIDPDGKVTTYGYDKLNRMSSASAVGGTTIYTYFRNSRLKSISYPNGTRASHLYDLANRIETIINSQGEPPLPISRYRYEYDRSANRTLQEETNGGALEATSYAYDDADRLTQVTYPDKKVTYVLDDVGNRSTETVLDLPAHTLSSSKSYAYDERDRISSATDSVVPSASATYRYDDNGNLTERTQNGVQTDFAYDARDELIEVDTAGVLTERYAYDYRGLRVRKSGGGVLLRYVYDDDAVLLQTDEAGATLAKYNYGPDRLLSLDHVTEGKQFYLFDALGSPVALSKPDGSLSARYKWDAWGNLRSSVGASANPFGFTGYEKDDATGLYYAKARFFDPSLGRFLTEDPFGGEALTPPSLHRYLYAFGNPTVFWDRSGRAGQKAFWEEDRPRVLGPNDSVPAGWTASAPDENGQRIATPPAAGQGEPDTEASSPGLFARALDWALDTAQEGLAALDKFNESISRWAGRKAGKRVQEAVGTSRPLTADEQELAAEGVSDPNRIRTEVGETFGEITQKGTELVAKTALELGEAEGAGRAVQVMDDVALARRGSKAAREVRVIEEAAEGQPGVRIKQIETTGTGGDPLGKVYRVSGDKTPSKKPYIGRTRQSSPKARGSRDGRDRTGADIVDTYDPNDAAAARRAEQRAMNSEGGLDNLDNRRNEIREDKWEEHGIPPPEDRH